MLAEKILCVDDELPVLRALSRTLRHHGFEVDTAEGPAAALEMAAANDYAVVATDYWMPEVDGLELIDQLRSHLPNATFMVISGQCNLDVAMSAINEHGITNLITKPWDSDDLASMMRRGIETHWEKVTQAQVSTNAVQHTRRLDEQKDALEAALVRSEALMAEALLNALDLRTRETRAHCRRVAAYAQILAEEMGLRGSVLASLEHGALLHDVGKIGVPDAILCKPGPLSEDEWDVMREHSAMGARVLDGFETLRSARSIVMQHHERWDGTGYPLQLSGPEIQVEARIVGVADTFDAILSNRPYRAAGTHAVAKAEIEGGRGKQFDPDVVDAFMRVSVETWDQVQERFPDESEKRGLFQMRAVV